MEYVVLKGEELFCIYMTDPVHLFFRKIHLVQYIKITLHDIGRFNTSATGPVCTEQKPSCPEFSQYHICPFYTISRNKIREDRRYVKIRIQLNGIFPLKPSEMTNNSF